MIWPNIKRRLEKDPHFLDVISTAYTAIKDVVESYENTKVTISYKKEPYMWSLLFVIDCKCSHNKSLALWNEISDNLLQHWNYSENQLSMYLNLIRLEVRSKEDSIWEDEF